MLIEDADLLAAVRAGDTRAYGALYERHETAAMRLARTLVRDPSDAQDLVAEAFANVLATLRRGHGPQGAFRAYLLTALRHAWASRAYRDRRLELTDDLSRYDAGEPFADPTLAELDRSYAVRAFGKLPERWRRVLWHTEVEGGTPAQVAPLLGLTPGGVAVLAWRARERLRQMYLQEHINCAGPQRTGTAARDASTRDAAPRGAADRGGVVARGAADQLPCQPATLRLGRYVRGGLAGRERSKVAAHLAGCPRCRRLHRELADVNASALPTEVRAPARTAGTPAAGVQGGG